METFIEWISAIGAVCLGIMVLAVFFTVLNTVQRRFTKTAILKIKGVFETSEWLNIHLNGAKTVERVKFVGFTDPESLKGIPYHLNHMAVFKRADGKRVLLRADTIRMIEELPGDT